MGNQSPGLAVRLDNALGFGDDADTTLAHTSGRATSSSSSSQQSSWNRFSPQSSDELGAGSPKRPGSPSAAQVAPRKELLRCCCTSGEREQAEWAGLEGEQGKIVEATLLFSLRKETFNSNEQESTTEDPESSRTVRSQDHWRSPPGAPGDLASSTDTDLRKNSSPGRSRGDSHNSHLSHLSNGSFSRRMSPSSTLSDSTRQRRHLSNFGHLDRSVAVAAATEEALLEDLTQIQSGIEVLLGEQQDIIDSMTCEAKETVQPTRAQSRMLKLPTHKSELQRDAKVPTLTSRNFHAGKDHKGFPAMI